MIKPVKIEIAQLHLLCLIGAVHAIDKKSDKAIRGLALLLWLRVLHVIAEIPKISGKQVCIIKT